MSFEDEVNGRMPTTIHAQLARASDLVGELTSLANAFTEVRLNGHSSLPIELGLTEVTSDLIVTLQVINLLNDGER